MPKKTAAKTPIARVNMWDDIVETTRAEEAAEEDVFNEPPKYAVYGDDDDFDEGANDDFEGDLGEADQEIKEMKKPGYMDALFNAPLEVRKK